MSLDIYYPPPITVRHFVIFKYQRQNDYAFHFHMSKTLVLRMQFYFNLCKTISLAGSLKQTQALSDLSKEKIRCLENGQESDSKIQTVFELKVQKSEFSQIFHPNNFI